MRFECHPLEFSPGEESLFCMQLSIATMKGTLYIQIHVHIVHCIICVATCMGKPVTWSKLKDIELFISTESL
jgi:hypothetical protein